MPFSQQHEHFSLRSDLIALKHSGVIALFNQHFVKTGSIPKAASKWLERAKLYREQADYGDFFIVSAKEAEAQIQSAREFIEEIETAVEKLK